MRLPEEDAIILKPDGSRKGPYKATFAGGTVFINDAKADVSDDDIVIRVLPNGNEEQKSISQATFYSTGIGGRGPHFQLKVGSARKIAPPQPSQLYNIHSSNVQIGNNNRQEIQSNISALIDLIDNAQTSQHEKDTAKSLLKKFIEHPLVVSLAGGAISLLG